MNFKMELKEKELSVVDVLRELETVKPDGERLESGKKLLQHTTDD